MLDFDKIIDDYLKRDERARQLGRYYPSDLGKCMRASYYGFMINKPMPAEKLRIFKIGDLIHEYMTKVLKAYADKEKTISVIDEQPLLITDMEEDLVISGRLDNFIKMKDGSDQSIVEVKSIKNVETYRGARKTWELREPTPEHIMQIQPYLKATRCNHGYILYISKTDGQTRKFKVDFSWDLFKEMVARARTLHRHLKANTLPEPESKMDDKKKWQCGWCMYKDECERNYVVPAAAHKALVGEELATMTKLGPPAPEGEPEKKEDITLIGEDK